MNSYLTLANPWVADVEGVAGGKIYIWKDLITSLFTWSFPPGRGLACVCSRDDVADGPQQVLELRA